MKRNNAEKASFIIPTLNEESSIEKTVKAGISCEVIDQVLVVDGESEDETYRKAEKAGANVVTQRKKGKGDAIRTGLKNSDNPISVFMDADILNIRPEMIRELVVDIQKDFDFVISDFDREGGRVTELVANPLLNKFFPEINLNQPLTGEFAGRTEILKKTPIRDGWGAQVDILIHNWLNEDIEAKETHIGFKDHKRKPLSELIDMADGVSTAIIEHARRLEKIKKIDSKMTPLFTAEKDRNRSSEIETENSEIYKAKE